MSAPELYIPPKPLSLWSVVALARVLWKGDGNLLELLPAAAYHFDVGNLGYSRRSTVLFNEPDAVREMTPSASPSCFSTIRHDASRPLLKVHSNTLPSVEAVTSTSPLSSPLSTQATDHTGSACAFFSDLLSNTGVGCSVFWRTS